MIAGFSVGSRHIPHHVWPAYPSLIILSGVGVAALNRHLAPRLGRAVIRAAVPVVMVIMIAAAAGYAGYVLHRFPRSACETQQAQAALADVPLCQPLLVATADGQPQWVLGPRMVHHFDADIAFVRIGDVHATEEGCTTLVGTPASASVPSDWRLISRGKLFSFYVP